MVVNTLNYTAVEDTIEYAKNNPAIEQISIADENADNVADDDEDIIDF